MPLRPRLALKIDVDTLRGTREGVPALVAALRRAQVGATFLFSLGPDHTGRAIRRVFRRGFVGKVQRTSVVSHYGLRTLLYGTLLPGPDIGRRCAATLRAVDDAGFEVGVHCWDHVRWQDGVARAGADWTAREMQLAFDRFAAVFGRPPRVHGAAGWQMNDHALRQLDTLGYTHASDGRGRGPFIPLVEGTPQRCVQLPTTLPTLDELIGRDGTTAANAADHLLAQTAAPPAHGHVFTLHAELEGQKLRPVFERLLAGWAAQGYELVSLDTLARDLDRRALPHCTVLWQTVPGRSGELIGQGPAMLASG